MTIVLLVAAALAMLVLTAFCAGAETGFLSVSRGRILHMARMGGKRAKIVHSALGDLQNTMTALLVGNNIAAVSYSSASTALATALFAGSPADQAAWGAAAAFIMLAVGEFLPKLLCAMRPLSRILALTPCWQVSRRFLMPVGTIVQKLISRFLPKREQTPRMTPETLLKILEDRKDGVRLSDFESALIGRLMVLRSRGEFVTPEALLAALDHDPEEYE